MTSVEVSAQVLRDLSGGRYTVESFEGHDEWLRGRGKSIGASEAAAVLGKSPWMDERDLWMRKAHPEKCKAEGGGNDDARRGSLSEAHVRALYEIETGSAVFDGTNVILRSVAHPWMTASLDGIIIYRGDGENPIASPVVPVVMEIKSVRRGGGEWTNETIPEHYLLQILHQLVVTGWEEARLVARFCRSDDFPTAYEREYTVRAEDYRKQMDALVRRERMFWEENVLKDVPPAVRLPSV